MQNLKVFILCLILVTAVNSAAATFHSEEMHPNRGLYLENIFYRIASVVCDGDFETADALFLKSAAKIPVGSEMSLEMIKSRCGKMRKNPQQLRADLVKHIDSTKEYIKKSSRLARTMGSLLEPLFEVAEPMRSKSGRVDGFVLYPSDVYLKNPQAFLNRLTGLARKDNFDPFELLSDSIKNPQSEVSMGILSLLTHNHQAEFNFIANVIVTRGVELGWQAYLNLNKLYKMERVYWENRPNILCSEKYLQALSYDEEGENLAYRACYSRISNGTQNLDIPVVKSYHFYGAWIMSYQLKRQALLPNALIPYAVSGMIGSYKTQTQGHRNRDVIVDLYRATARMFLSTRFLSSQ